MARPGSDLDRDRPYAHPICELTRQPSIPKEDIEGVTSHLRQLKEYDPDGQRFRYATVKTKKKSAGRVRHRRSLSEKLKHVNIYIFASEMEKLSDYISGLESWLCDLLSYKVNAESEMQG